MTAAALTADLAAFFESGTTIIVGTRDTCHVPECIRALGVRVEPDGRELTVFLPEATSAVTQANLRDNGRVAVCFTRVPDHRSIQVKGRVVSMGPAGAGDRAVVEAHRAALADTLGFVGVPRRTVYRFAHWPCQAVRVAVEALFVQTPGPGAGDALGGGGR